jgi:hemerythrin-like domain-containing protein
LERAAGRLEAGQAVEPAFFFDAVRFIRGFADGCHHRKEEGVLFEAMSAAGMPVEEGPIGVMLYEHEEGRAYTRAMHHAAQRLERGETGASRELIASARGYVALLREHILKEDRVLFPMADSVIPSAAHERVLQGFERVEHAETGPGVHQRYMVLAEDLERRIPR